MQAKVPLDGKESQTDSHVNRIKCGEDLQDKVKKIN